MKSSFKAFQTKSIRFFLFAGKFLEISSTAVKIEGSEVAFAVFVTAVVVTVVVENAPVEVLVVFVPHAVIPVISATVNPVINICFSKLYPPHAYL